MAKILKEQIAKITFDWSGTDSAGTANSAVGTGTSAHGTGVFIPTGAIITNAYMNVTTAPTTATTTTLGVGVETTTAGSEDIVAGITVAGAPWSTTGIKGGLPGSYLEATVAGDTAILDAARKAGSYVLTTANREVKVAVGTAALTAGVVKIYIHYVV